MTPYKYIYVHLSICLLVAMSCLVACDVTKGVPEGEHLYVGIDKVNYTNYEKNDHFVATQEEVEAALACEPNGALFGSSYYRSPFQYRLWLWNKYHDRDTKFARWMTKSFGKAPVLMSNVTPDLRATVAQSTLVSHGYFNGTVSAHEVEMSNPKKQKVRYDVDMGHLYTLDSISYDNFPEAAMTLIDSLSNEKLIATGDPFDVSTLDAERTRLATLFRDNGYFFYEPGYASYLADTLQVPGKVQLRLQLADSLPDQVLRRWHIGKIDVNVRRDRREELDTSLVHRRKTLHFHGSRPPVRKEVILGDVRISRRKPFDYSQYQESVGRLANSGLYSSVDFSFTPREADYSSDTLDLLVNCILDKPYDFYVETNMKGKTSGFLGPQLIVGLTKRNAFKGGEKLDVNMHGSYEWQTGHPFDGSSSRVNSYEYGFDASLEIPRIVNPFRDRDREEKIQERTRQSTETRNRRDGITMGTDSVSSNTTQRRRRRRRYFSTPSTLIKASSTTVNRSGYFKRHIVSGELTYKIQPSQRWMHEITPLMVEYNYLKKGTDKFFEMVSESPYLLASMMDIFIPKLKYSVKYTSPSDYRNPIYWNASVSEAGNLLSLGYMIAGKKWGDPYKELFKNPYAQFFKVETGITKHWSVSEHDKLVAHADAGVIWSYGNSQYAPYTEQFWVGGANSIRAFTVRSVGPGNYRSYYRKWRFIEQVGDIKLQANLEYRPRLFDNLYGAIFLDAGNVWSFDAYDEAEDYKFDLKDAFSQVALGTGIGLRYDLDFFVIRLDWGVALHAPYDTGKSGFYNIKHFKDGQSIHFAIGYPF